MVSVTIGMLMVAALATLIADQSSNRSEADKSGRLIENGRYAIRTIADDLQMGGYWGELNVLPATPATPPDPCSAALANVKDAMALHVQGYAPPGAGETGYNPAGNPAAVPACLNNHRPGTDILVVRHADPDSSDVETAGVLAPGKVVADRLYLQTGLQPTGTQFTYAMDRGSNLGDRVHAAEEGQGDPRHLAQGDGAHLLRGQLQCLHRWLGGHDPDAQDGRTEGWDRRMSAAVSIAEGVENMQVDYGLDSDGDGTPNGVDSAGKAPPVLPADGDSAGKALALAPTDWPNVMSVRINLLVRSLETSPGYTDTKTYNMGAVGSTAAANDGYKRHAFVQTVRLVNPGGRRAP